MASGRTKTSIWMILIIVGLASVGWMLVNQIREKSGVPKTGRTVRPVPVETAPIRRGPISLRHTFSGELEALAEFVVAPKVGGRVERMLVNIADTVSRGQVVAQLDNDEYVQTVAQARADLLVAKANLAEAESALKIAEREFERTSSLLKSGISSDSEFDAAGQDRTAKQTRRDVAAAQVAKAESALETANIRLGYTQVTAGWTGGDDRRVVAERFVDEGQTVAANTPLLSIVQLHPIVGVVHVGEKDYAYLEPGQSVSLTTDAYPRETYAGHIDRIAPVFLKSTRQARVEMIIDNPRYRLKPGMFIRASVVLAHAADAMIVPQLAVTRRDDTAGVFIVAGDGQSVVWRPVKIGIRDGDRVQIEGEGLSGRVVTLGQQLVENGSPTTVAVGQTPPASETKGRTP